MSVVCKGFSLSKDNGMILIFKFPFTNIYWTTCKLDAIYFLLRYERSYLLMMPKSSVGSLVQSGALDDLVRLAR